MLPRLLLAALLLPGCATYGFHRPARTLPKGAVELGVSFDLVRFFSGRPEAERTPEDLTQGLLLPALNLRVGLPAQLEANATLHAGGVRVGARARVLGDATSRAAVAAEAGLTLAGMVDTTAHPTRNFRVVLLPDAALVGGFSPVAGGEAVLAARYLWLREKIAGPDFGHTPALTAGYLQRLGPVVAGGELTGFWAPGTGSFALSPGASVAVTRP